MARLSPDTCAASALEAEAAFNNYKAVEADLRAAQFAVQQRTIRAPFDGVIAEVAVEVGEWITPSPPRMVISGTPLSS